MTDEQSPNVLIEYTKWIFKNLFKTLLLILLLVALGLSAFWLTERKAPLISLECTRLDETKLLVTIKSKYFSDEPYAIYRGAHHAENFGPSTNYKDLHLLHNLSDSDVEYYWFGIASWNISKSGIRINRKNLDFEVVLNMDDDLKIVATWPCKEIEYGEFISREQAETERRQSELRF